MAYLFSKSNNDLCFEDEIGHGWQCDDFSGHETQLLVLVEDRVHALDPLRINRTVEDQPFPVCGFPDYSCIRVLNLLAHFSLPINFTLSLQLKKLLTNTVKLGYNK